MLNSKLFLRFKTVKMNSGTYNLWMVYIICIFAQLSNAQYRCYQWTAVDRKEMGTEPSVATEKAQCEKRLHSFTKGDNGKYTGCGSCWCCMKLVESTNLGAGSAKVLSMWCSLLKKVGAKRTFKSQC